MNDEQLVKGCVEGRPSAQKYLFEKYSRKMMGVCLRYATERQEAEDVLQEGFIKVFNAIGTFNNQGSLEGWVRKIMVNTALDNYRKNSATKHAVEIDEMQDVLGKDNDIVETMEAEGLLSLLQKLPEGYRVVFNMYAMEGYTHKEIAEQLGISANTSKSQYSRARTYIQKMLKAEKII
jgi:RNA polymerase sigma-70 factor (ECF subfamily)